MFTIKFCTYIGYFEVNIFKFYYFSIQTINIYELVSKRLYFDALRQSLGLGVIETFIDDLPKG